jgi:hypothetical protein
MEGHTNRKIRVMTELILRGAKERIENRKEPKLTVGQYNAIYEAVQEMLDGNI